MKKLATLLLVIQSFIFSGLLYGQDAEKMVDIPTRSGVTQRFLYLSPDHPKAAAILFAGGHGGLQISDDGNIHWGANNFLVRTRQLFADDGIAVAVVDAPSDRQVMPFLAAFRQTPEHVADMKAVIAWLRDKTKLPVWLIGTSRGTQSAAFVAIQLGKENGGPNGLVLTSTILIDNKSHAVPEMPLEKLTIPVLVVHHEQDGCFLCPINDIPMLMEKLTGSPRKELISFTGGNDRGDPCGALAHHGYNGLEEEVVSRISQWILETK